jgi:hypothetical protein
MAFVQRATSTLLLLLVAGGSVGCDVEEWMRLLSGDAPAELERVAQLEPAGPRPAPRLPKSEPAADEPLRAPAPPPSPRSSFSRFSSSSAQSKPARSSYAPLAAVARATPREIQPGSDACEKVRSGALRMQGYVESIERKIEGLEEVANDIDRSPRWREGYEAQMEAAEESLDRAEEELGDYIQSQRQRGVPLGCLR